MGLVAYNSWQQQSAASRPVPDEQHPTDRQDALPKLTLTEQPLTDAEDPFPPTVRVTISLRPSPSTGTPKCSSSCHTRHITAKQLALYPERQDKRGGEERGMRRVSVGLPHSLNIVGRPKLYQAQFTGKYQVCFCGIELGSKLDGSKCACTTTCDRWRYMPQAKHRTERTEKSASRAAPLFFSFNLA